MPIPYTSWSAKLTLPKSIIDFGYAQFYVLDNGFYRFDGPVGNDAINIVNRYVNNVTIISTATLPYGCVTKGNDGRLSDTPVLDFTGAMFNTTELILPLASPEYVWALVQRWDNVSFDPLGAGTIWVDAFDTSKPVAFFTPRAGFFFFIDFTNQVPDPKLFQVPQGVSCEYFGMAEEEEDKYPHFLSLFRDQE